MEWSFNRVAKTYVLDPVGTQRSQLFDARGDAALAVFQHVHPSDFTLPTLLTPELAAFGNAQP